MSSELEFTRHPLRTYLKWTLVYVIIAGLVIAIVMLLATRIRTYSIPSGALSLTTPYSRYLVGEPVTFTLRNNFNAPIYVTNNCPSEPLAVYYQVNGVWQPVHDTTSIDSCASSARQIVIPVGGEQQGSFAAWPNLFSTPGKYRIVAFVEYFNAVPYQDIEIVAKPVPVVVQPTTPSYQNTTPTTPSTPSTPQYTYPREPGDD